MRHSKHGLKALGLSLMAALSLMAFTVGVAQAGELKGDWVLILSNGTLELLAVTESIDGKVDVAGSLLVPAKNISIKCLNFDVIEGNILKLEIVGGVSRSFGDGKLLFLECETYNLKLEKLNCLPNPDKNPKSEITAEVLFHVVRTGSNGTAYVLVESAGGLTGSIFVLEFLPPCALPEEIEVKGSVVLHFASATEQVEQLVLEAPESVQLLFGDGLKFGTSAATIDGSAWVLLSGANAGRKWGIEAGF